MSLSLSSGYVFAPTDYELLVDYLRKKIDGEPIPENAIREVNLYAHDPEELAGCDPLGRFEWYFFTRRTRRHGNGRHPDRSVIIGAANSVKQGHWKATTGDKEIKFDGRKVGYRKSLVYYRGRNKTTWIMYEYRVADPPRRSGDASDMFDDYVLCRIHNKDFKVRGSKRGRDERFGNDDQSPSSSNIPRLEHNVQSPGMRPVADLIPHQVLVNPNDNGAGDQQKQQPLPLPLPLPDEHANAMVPGANSLQALPYQAGNDFTAPSNVHWAQYSEFYWECLLDSIKD